MRVVIVRSAWMLVAVMLAACQGQGAIEPTPSPSPSPSPTPLPVTDPDPEPTVEPEPTADPEAEREAQLVELRASDAFVEFAEHDRAQTGRWSMFTYPEFGMSADGQIVAEWTNKAELWDQIAPPFRDECLLAGPPATDPIWDDEIMIPVGVTARWNDEATQGRGQFLDLACAYLDEAAEETVERYGGVLIQTSLDGAGTVVATMPAVEIREGDVSSHEERRALLRPQLWDWVSSQPSAS